MLEENGPVWEEADGMTLKTALDCVDEIERRICLLTGLRHMNIDLLDAAQEIRMDSRVRQAYTDILYRETAYAMSSQCIQDPLQGCAKAGKDKAHRAKEEAAFKRQRADISCLNKGQEISSVLHGVNISRTK